MSTKWTFGGIEKKHDIYKIGLKMERFYKKLL